MLRLTIFYPIKENYLLKLSEQEKSFLQNDPKTNKYNIATGDFQFTFITYSIGTREIVFATTISRG